MDKAKREALDKCRKLWVEIAETGDTKGTIYKRFGWDFEAYYCPACAYVESLGTEPGYGDSDEPECAELCPVLWETSGGCLGGDTPYSRWCDRDPIEPAWDMVKLIDRSIEGWK